MKVEIAKKYNALSLFNGMGFGPMALESLNIKVDKCYSSEIDKYANQATFALFPDVIQLGDVTKWREWGIDWSSIYLLIGGPPCQGFSFAGKQAGTKAILDGVEYIVTTREMYLEFKEKGAVFLSQSYLFWEYILCLDHVKLANPNVKFLLENVKMKKELLAMITEAIGVEPICINSALVSAQNRVRYYWTNIEGVDQPEDKGFLLKDIIEHDGGFTFMSDKFVARQEGRKCLRDNLEGKAVNLSAMEYVKNGRQGDYINQTAIDNSKAYALTASYAAGMMASNSVNRKQRTLQPLGKTEEETNQTHLGIKYRKLTPRECFRLQTVPEHHIDTLLSSGISNSQLYKMCGNGFTHDVIVHIFKGLPLFENSAIRRPPCTI